MSILATFCASDYNPSGPIFYPGGLYGEIRTRKKYNATLVTSDRFSTSSAAPPKVRIRRAAFSKLYFWVDMQRGRISPRKFEIFHNWAKPSPRSNPATMHRTITGILRKINEIEASSMGVETLRGYNLCRPPGCNPKTRDHKQASIFVEFADAFSCHTAQADTKFSTKFSM
jgi:hypothetical protein